MNSTEVSRTLREIVRPVLLEHGFNRSTPRRFWRHSEKKIDVMEFRSWNKYNADVIGITTFSFALELGVFLPFVPDPFVKKKDGVLFPETAACHFRRVLRKNYGPGEPDRQGNWYVLPDGSNLRSLVKESREAVERNAFAWFDRFENLDSVKRILLEDFEDMEETWGMGNLPSPYRSFLTAHVALKLNDLRLARDSLRAVVDSGLSFPGEPDLLYAALNDSNDELSCRS